MKRIQRGPVRGISFKLQEEERERKDQYVPEVSALDFTQNSESGMLDVDQETKDLLKSMGVSTRSTLAMGSAILTLLAVRQHLRQRRGRAAAAGRRERSQTLRRQGAPAQLECSMHYSRHACFAAPFRLPRVCDRLARLQYTVLLSPQGVADSDALVAEDDA